MRRLCGYLKLTEWGQYIYIYNGFRIFQTLRDEDGAGGSLLIMHHHYQLQFYFAAGNWNLNEKPANILQYIKAFFQGILLPATLHFVPSLGTPRPPWSQQ